MTPDGVEVTWMQGTDDGWYEWFEVRVKVAKDSIGLMSVEQASHLDGVLTSLACLCGEDLTGPVPGSLRSHDVR